MVTKMKFLLSYWLAAMPAIVGADEWPQFRGHDGSATSSGKQLPEQWGPDKNIAWKAKLPGYGWSSPIIWGDKVFVTTAVTDKQSKPSAGFGGGGGPGAFGRPGQILPPFLQVRLSATPKQKTQLEEMQKEIDGKLEKVLTEEQNMQLKTMRGGFGPGRAPGAGERGPGGGGGRGEGGAGRGGPGGFGAFPQPGQILAPFLKEGLKLTADQKKQVEELQKEVDGRLEKVLTDEQNKQLKTVRERFGRGGFGGPGGRGRGGFGGAKPPEAVYRWEVYCLDRATGKVLWNQIALESKPRIPTQSSNTYASETPVTDGERVYTYFGMHGVFCYDFAGKLLWKVDLGSYPMALGFGTGSSPVLDDGRLFVQCDNEEKSFLVALDAKTGKELWRTARPERTGWSTPFIWKNKIRTEVVCVGSPRVRSYDPATGKQLWELGGMAGQAKASPVASLDLLYVGTGGGGFGGFGGGGGPSGPGGGFGEGGARPFFAVKAGASGEIKLKDGARSNDSVAWQLPQAGPQTASPLRYERYLYVLAERGGILSCYDEKTGKQVYKERLPGARGFTSSPWAYDGKVFCLDDGGTTHVVHAGPKFKVLAKNTINEMCWSSPAVADGALFLRGVDHLYCIKTKGEEK